MFNPHDAELLAEVPLGDSTHVEAATQAAALAFERSRQEPAYLRADRLLALTSALEQKAEEFAQIILAEAGKPIDLARTEVRRAINTFRLAAEEARHQRGGWLDLEATAAGRQHHGLNLRFPVGTIAAITPFNFPLNLVAHKLAPALACGCPVILKPSPRTPLTAIYLAQTAEIAGLPPGDFNVVTCPNERVPDLLRHPSISMVSFTGSAPVGRALQALAPHKRWTLELGGNATVLVHSDADLPQAAAAIATGGLAYAGQTCISVQNVLVHREVYPAFREHLLSFIQNSIRSGDPIQPGVLVGPMIDPAAAQAAFERVQKALGRGALVALGGTRHGPWLEPTVLENVPLDADVWTEEIFAPVLSLAPYDQFEEALSVVNTSKYGLQTGVFTQSLSLAWLAFQKLQTGAVLINQSPSWRVENMPYGGVKQSGEGREGIAAAIETMTSPRSWIWKQPL